MIRTRGAPLEKYDEVAMVKWLDLKSGWDEIFEF
jgi:hypothetical protein